MRSLVMSLFFFTSALSAALGEALVCQCNFYMGSLDLTISLPSSVVHRPFTCMELHLHRHPGERHWDLLLVLRPRT